MDNTTGESVSRAVVESSLSRQLLVMIILKPKGNNLLEEFEELMKIIKRSDYKIVEQLNQTPSKISILSLLLCSESHRNALMKILGTAFVPQEIFVNQLEGVVAGITALINQIKEIGETAKESATQVENAASRMALALGVSGDDLLEYQDIYSE